MLIVLRSGGREHDLDVSFQPGADVADLATALDLPASAPLRIDGVAVGPGVAVDTLDLRDGALVEAAGGLPPSCTQGHTTLVATGGPSCGVYLPVGRAGVRVGSSAVADLTIDDPRLAPLHFSVRRTAGKTFDVADLGSDSGTRREGQVVYAGGSRFEIRTEPARAWAAFPDDPETLVAPDPPADAAEGQPLPWLSVAVPMLTGIVLAWLFHPMMLLMTFMGPVMILAGWIERQRQARRRTRRQQQEWKERLAEFAQRVAVAHAEQTAVARSGQPDPAAMLALGIAGPATEGATIPVVLGREDRRWDPRIEGSAAGHADVRRVLEQAGPLADVPAVARVSHGDRVSVSGPAGPAQALCRWVVLQLAVSRRAEDLRLEVCIDDAGDEWDWYSRLPHLTSPAAQAVAVGVALDNPTVEFAYGTPGLTDGITREIAADLARLVARRESAESGAAIPLPGLGLGAAFGGRPQSAETILAHWGTERSARLPTILGVGVDGPEVVDLAAAGPHALLAGTTGSGKSELLRTLVATTAALVSPEQVNFVLIDYKGGSAFDACADLPHVVGVVTDLDGALAERALRSLEAELARRESILREAGASDIALLPRGVMPRLCLVIDELASLVSEHRAFTDSLVGIAQRGRSLGVHLVMATQRPSGAVTPAIRANTNMRVCLRVQDPLDSEDVVASPLAAQIPRDLPGRGWLRTGPGELVAIQGVDTAIPMAQPRSVQARRWGTPESAPNETAGGRTGLETVVDAAVAAWRSVNGAAPRRPWPDPLPETIHRAELPRPPSGIAIGLVDDPDNQRVDTLGWDITMGHVALAGGPRSGRTTALLSIADGVSASGHATLVGIDAGGGDLAPMGALGRCRSIADVGDPDNIVALLADLASSCQRGRRDEAAVVVVIDGLGSLLATLESRCDFNFMARLARMWSDGPSRGISCAVSVDRPAAVPRDFAASTANTLVLALSDPLDHLSVVGSPCEGRRIPGRGHELRGRRAIQMATPGWL